MLTNHRDAPRYVVISPIHDGHDSPLHVFQLGARRTAYLQDGSIGLPSSDTTNLIAAMRIRAIPAYDGDDLPDTTVDPLGRGSPTRAPWTCRPATRSPESACRLRRNTTVSATDAAAHSK